MTDRLRTAFESFLVEDVILTLGNLRGSLGWMGPDTGLNPDTCRAGIDRIDRQIGQLEDRARDVCRLLREAGYTQAELVTELTGGEQAPQIPSVHAMAADPSPLLLLSPLPREEMAPVDGERDEDTGAEDICLATAIQDALSENGAAQDDVTLPVFRSKRA